MELPEAGYLYALATISITYAGFAALAIILRQAIGGKPSDLDAFFIRNVLVRSFMIAGFSILPPLLAMFKLPQSTIWRASGAVAAVLQCLFILIWYLRRRTVTDRPLPRLSLANVIFQLLTALFLLLNAAGIAFAPGAGPFSAGVTAFMLSAAIAYMIALGTLLEETPGRKGQRKKLEPL